MGHPQPPTPIQTDNSTALGVVTNTINPSAPKPWTCVSTGCVVVSTRNISGHTGAQGPPT
eukprot:CCRYP_013516-RC/>CCRYP_013516-RC protein AED:0.48 eAED:0.48 QI:0/-1/0/1/-1/0/1/0/59